jgi:nitrogen-specific signal transduction histidine kinase
VTEAHLARLDRAASEARFAAFMRRVPVGMHAKDAEGRHVSLNPETERVFGRPAAGVLVRHPRAFLPPEVVTVIDAVTIEVRDNGRGLPEALRDRIFDACFTTESAGTGTGLSFCRAVVEAYGGVMELTPSASGARFRLILPVPAGAEEDAVCRRDPHGQGAWPSLPAPGRG